MFPGDVKALEHGRIHPHTPGNNDALPGVAQAAIEAHAFLLEVEGALEISRAAARTARMC